MTVLANADKCQVNRALGQKTPDRGGGLRGILFAVQQVIPSDRHFADEPIEQVSTKAGRMIDGQTDVFVQVEQPQLTGLNFFFNDSKVRRARSTFAGSCLWLTVCAVRW